MQLLCEDRGVVFNVLCRLLKLLDSAELAKNNHESVFVVIPACIPRQ
jgi:hypothetical protein